MPSNLSTPSSNLSLTLALLLSTSSQHQIATTQLLSKMHQSLELEPAKKSIIRLLPLLTPKQRDWLQNLFWKFSQKIWGVCTGCETVTSGVGGAIENQLQEGKTGVLLCYWEPVAIVAFINDNLTAHGCCVYNVKVHIGANPKTKNVDVLRSHQPSAMCAQSCYSIPERFRRNWEIRPRTLHRFGISEPLAIWDRWM